MQTSLVKTSKVGKNDNQVLLLSKDNKITSNVLTYEEKKYVAQKIKSGSSFITINKLAYSLFLVPFIKESKKFRLIEKYRDLGAKIATELNGLKLSEVNVTTSLSSKDEILALSEGMVLSNYQFLKYFSDAKKRKNSLKKVSVFSDKVSSKEVSELANLCISVCYSRDLVNEPLSYLTAEQMSSEVQKLAKESGFSVKVLRKKQIEALKMGGLLAVNKGSVDPPTFNIMEWKPKNAKNKKPYVLVGKGVVYDTGGMSLKPTRGSMDEMKCDMGGAATVIGTMYSLAKNKADVHVIALVPATDNRPGGNAYVPGDVIKMYSGKTIEVLNTDAEGRMILADALAYAQHYKPKLVLDFATLTGSAQAAIGNFASVTMGNASDTTFKSLEKAGEDTFERIVRFPFWSEYGGMIKSSIADAKNVGGAFAGAITAGKFLEIFTKDKKGKAAYPWIHVDIAGPAFLSSKDSYRSKEGTGYGVRLMYDFLTKQK